MALCVSLESLLVSVVFSPLIISYLLGIPHILLIIVDVKERIFLAKRFISYAKYPSLDSTLDQAAFRLVMKPFMLASALVDGMYRVHALWYVAAVSLYLLSVLLVVF